MKQKKQTAKMSELRDYLDGMIEEVGDKEVFFVDAKEDVKEGDAIKFIGLAANGVLAMSADTEDSVFMIMSSDEEIKLS